MLGLKKFNHYCFTKEVNVITDHTLLVAMVSKYDATLSQWLQCLMLHIHQYNMYTLHKPVPDLQIADWLVPVCTSIEDIRTTMHLDTELQMLQAHIIRG